MKITGRYKIYDSYECDITGEWDCSPECIGTSDNITGVKDIIKQRIEDTDGECYIEIWDGYKQKFISINGCE